MTKQTGPERGAPTTTLDGKAPVLSIRVRRDGVVQFTGPLPERIVLSQRYLAQGGKQAIGDHKRLLKEAKAHVEAGETELAKEKRHQARGINTDPVFTRDGQDLIFTTADGVVRYNYVDFATKVGADGEDEPDYLNLVFDLAH